MQSSLPESSVPESSVPAGKLDVKTFSDDLFFDALIGSRFSGEDARGHRRAQYLCSYLQTIGAKTIVTERQYVDADYLGDFSSFYVSCFEPYERFCTRLHFFSRDISEASIRSILVNEAAETEVKHFQNSYLGFIVVRPLPNAVIGRTVLKTYPSDNDRRHYPVIVPYKVTLFGIPLSIDSLAYQEQDTAVAACATVSIWCALHRTSHVYGTPRPRPAVITADATRSILYERAIPSTGLRLEQMIAAIRAANLDPEVYEPIPAFDNIAPLASLIYAYVRGGLPVILVIDIEGQGAHAVTISGFSLQKKRVVQNELPKAWKSGTVRMPITPAIPMTGLRINEFYAHDDQVGPFSRIKIHRPNPRAVDPEARAWSTWFQSETWSDSSGTPLTLTPTAIIVPVYHKLRLSFDSVRGWLARLQPTLMAAAEKRNQRDIEWDVFVTETNDYKSTVDDLNLNPDRRFGLLASSQPRFIWRTTFLIDAVPKAEFLFDATGFTKSFPVFAINWFDKSYAERVKEIVETKLVTRQLTPALATLILREVHQRESSDIGLPRGATTKL